VIRPRVLFVTHRASATGAPTVLLRLLRWLHGRDALDAHVLCWHGGPLSAAFAAVAPTTVLEPEEGLGALGAAEQTLTTLGLRGPSSAVRHWGVNARRSLRGPWDVLYLNGAASFAAVPHLPRPVAGTLAHIHELEVGLERSLAPDQQPLLMEADRYLAVAPCVEDLLVRLGVPAGQISVQGGFVDDAAPAAVQPEGTLRARLGIPVDAPVVGGAGDVIWRKGPDLFLRLALASAEAQPDAHFVWVGARSALTEQLERDARRAGVAGRVHFVGHQQHPTDWFRLFDTLVLTSREDPFPLVCLEAAQVGTPLVAFDQGGVGALLDAAGEGGVVPPLDVPALAAAVDQVLRHRPVAPVAALKAAVEERYVSSVAAPALLHEIYELAGSTSRS
jgi:glycosyltransferase involved in cell wall biosynthesis